MKVIILAGGGGSRLFPLSRSCYPKQFLNIAGNESLLVQTIKRFLGIVKAEDIVVVTNEDYIYHVYDELKKANAEKAHVLTEPVGRNTAPAITIAMAYCKEILKCNRQEILFVSPSDHLVKPEDEFRKLIEESKLIATDGNIVTFGIHPYKPETGYGYIKVSSEYKNGFKVEAFKEKPDLALAKKYMNDGRYYWNSGMFMFSIECMENNIEKYSPDIFLVYKEGFNYLHKSFINLPNISIDYAVAEKTEQMILYPMNNIYWNDIGSWDAIAEAFSDEAGNVYNGDIVVENCNNSMILGKKRLIAGIDLDNIMIVDTDDVLLVAKKGSSQDVKKIVENLKLSGRKEVNENTTMYRPWGGYTILAEGDGYKVKRITINPGAKLSLQMHYHRSEHWTVISGTGKLTVDDKVVIFKENESTYIPVGTKHRLENPGHIPLSIIEVQNGKYLDEDDIIRFDDDYNRV